MTSVGAGRSDSAYVLGHSDRELARLERQAGFFADATRDILLRAGIRPGMRVLDLGCGVGDVSALAAELVGAGGSIVGIDSSAEALAIAERRMQEAGRDWVSFQQVNIEDFNRQGEFDAIIGRFILLHFPAPGAAIKGLVEKCRPGTTVAFAEMDLSTAAALPPLPLLATCMGWIVEAYRRAGRQPDMGANLYAAFRSAGLVPRLAGFTRISDGADRAGFDFLVESVKSLLPAMEALGVVHPDEVGIETLGERLSAEAAPGAHCIFYPRLVGAWAETG